MLSRRHVLELFTATAAAGVAGCADAATADSDPAAPWRNPGAGEKDLRRWALAHAILAPNPHNRQPWLIDLVGDDRIVFRADPTRTLPATDPPNRQITIGCGAFLELLDLAAREAGARAEIQLWPEGEPQPLLDGRPVADIRLVRDPAVARDPLFAQITRRRTSRTAYDLKAPPTPGDLAQVTTAAAPLAAGSVATGAPLADLIEICRQGWVTEMHTPAAMLESAKVTRVGRKAVAANPDGIALQGPFFEAMAAAGVLTEATLADPNSYANRSGIEMYEKLIRATPAFVWLKADDNSRATQIAAGRAYARMCLTATALGLSMQPWSMTLQEYPEMADLYRKTQAVFGVTPEAPLQMLARIGRAKAVDPAPRWALAKHIRT